MSNVEEQRQKRLVHLRAIEADLEKANLSIRKMDETVVKFSSADPVPPDVTTRYAKIVSASQEALVEVRREISFLLSTRSKLDAHAEDVLDIVNALLDEQLGRPEMTNNQMRTFIRQSLKAKFKQYQAETTETRWFES